MNFLFLDFLTSSSVTAEVIALSGESLLFPPWPAPKNTGCEFTLPQIGTHFKLFGDKNMNKTLFEKILPVSKSTM